MIVNLIKTQQMFSAKLPSKINGQYWIHDLDESGKTRDLFAIEAIGGEWVLKSSPFVVIMGEQKEPLERVVLEENVFLDLRLRSSQERMLLVTHPQEEGSGSFEKYLVKRDCVLSVGRSADNQIMHPNRYISAHHAELSYQNGTWGLEDLNSTNGTYVNGQRAGKCALKTGDVIYIMGVRIIVGKQFLAVNNVGGYLQIHTTDLEPFVNQRIEKRTAQTAPAEYFYRSPRFVREITPLVLSIDAPPQPEKTDTVPTALLMGPAITMGMASVGSGTFSVLNTLNGSGSILNVMPTVIMSASMLLGTVLWPVLTKKYEKKDRIKKENIRQEKYFKYLDDIRDKMKRAAYEQKHIWEERLISSEECKRRILERDRGLWERMPEQADFLRLRAGVGELPLCADIKYPEHRFSMANDSLQDAMYLLGKEKLMLEQVPISISLRSDSRWGMIGDRECVKALTRSLILQVIALHSYDEVKLVMLLNESEVAEWESLFSLPHLWNREKSVRYLAANTEEMKALSVYMEKEILERTGKREDDKAEIPYFLIVAADKKLAEKSEVFVKLMERKDSFGYAILMLYDELRNLSKETTGVIEVSRTEGKIYDRNGMTGKVQRFAPEFTSIRDLEEAAFAASNIELELSDENYALPGMITFLEMFGVGKINHLNSLQRWKENNPAITLQTPVGIDTGGSLFYLDLHQDYHGPHGLVAGMTGSGKSEFIITYILSLAVNYHPSEVAFILIDYKGGGLAGAFEDEERNIKLPHLAGTITNLDGAAVTRSLISIQSELRRRQRLFNEAKKIANEGTMDIYQYQILYRNHTVSEPIPHLFIISDEFAELKAQQPEFMEQLISTARIGRSLGVHLILATQKPAGVVDDQIWSNSRFRVCLKVQDKADSMDMIKRPDAAELSRTGRFYLQVGFNEYFAMGQSAWCGADYIPSDYVEKKEEDSIQMVNHLGRVVKEVKPVRQVREESEKRIKQVVGIVKYLSDLAEEEHVAVRPLWLPPISELIYVEEIYQKYGVKEKAGCLNPVVGEYDDPFNQKQYELRVNFSENGNCLVYGSSGNGKTTFVTSMIYSLLRCQSAEYLNLYLMDFGSETLKIFEQAPQVGGVVLSQEEEKIRNLGKMLNGEIETRKKLFADYGGDMAGYLNHSGKVVPGILVVINNYTGFGEQYEEELEQFIYLFRDGVKYGIYFCVTVNSINGIRSRAAQNFSQIFTMQLNDPGDYAVVLGKTDGTLPARHKGRGLVRLDKVYEFQTAYCCDGKQQERLREFCGNLAQTNGITARQIPVLPKIVNAQILKRYVNGFGQMPAGIDKNRLQPVTVPLEKEYISLVASQDQELAVRTAYALAKLCSFLPGAVAEIWDAGKLLPAAEESNPVVIQEQLEEAVVHTFQELAERNKAYKSAGMNASVLETYQQKVIVICSMQQLVSVLSEDGADKMRVFLEKGQSTLKVRFILAGEERQIRSYSAQGWYRDHVHPENGIWVGDGFADQNVIRTAKFSSSFREEIGEQFGYVVCKGKPVLAKLAMEEIR